MLKKELQETEKEKIWSLKISGKLSHSFFIFLQKTQKREQTKPEHRLVDFAGRLLAQKSRVVTLDGKQRHDTLKTQIWTRWDCRQMFGQNIVIV